MSEQFKAWIDAQVATKFKTATALANALDMQLPAFVRGVQKGTFSVLNLLRLARITETHPSTVLRLAAKDDVADLIEDLYQVSEQTPRPASAAERRHLERWRQITPAAQHSVDTIMAHLPTQHERRRAASSRKTSA